MTAGGPSLYDVMAERGAARPDARAYAFLDEHGEEQQVLSFGELERAVEQLARRLAASALPGHRALLAFPPGLDFLVAFFACLRAGLVCVPVMPPRKGRVRDSALAIFQDCRPAVGLSVERHLATVREAFAGAPGSERCFWLAVDGPASADAATYPQDGAPAVPPARPGLALLQYTSGSTSSPKGVMVTHANLLANLEMIRARFGNDHRSTYVSWVPLYHDMGLIYNVLQSLYCGAPCVLMAPAHFVQRPIAWLRAIDRYRARVAGAPNFAFDLCVDRCRDEDVAGLDLSSWEIAFNGAEPVRAETLERFAARFAPCGFRHRSLYPCYGMAEATLLISGGRPGLPPLLYPSSRAALLDGRVLPAEAAGDRTLLVGCGSALVGEQIAIIDPVSSHRAKANAVGEVWVQGPHVAGGYWEKAEASARTFQAVIAGESAGHWLRTGDLGWCGPDGELYITGRLKDMIIIRGANHYPQDIEHTVERSSPQLRPHCNAAFSVLRDGVEALVVVQEVERTFRHHLALEDTLRTIRSALVREHELAAAEIVLIRPGTIPKTTSGKIRRALTRELWLAGMLERVDAGMPQQDEAPGGAHPPHAV